MEDTRVPSIGKNNLLYRKKRHQLPQLYWMSIYVSMNALWHSHHTRPIPGGPFMTRCGNGVGEALQPRNVQSERLSPYQACRRSRSELSSSSLGSFNIPPVSYLHSENGSCGSTDRAGQHESHSWHSLVLFLLLSCGRSRGRLTNTLRTCPPWRSPLSRSSSPLCLAPSSTRSESLHWEAVSPPEALTISRYGLYTTSMGIRAT